jgi:hypothetical protein
MVSPPTKPAQPAQQTAPQAAPRWRSEAIALDAPPQQAAPQPAPQPAQQGPTVGKIAQNAANSWWEGFVRWLGPMAILAFLAFAIERGFRWVKTGRRSPVQPPPPPKK